MRKQNYRNILKLARNSDFNKRFTLFQIKRSIVKSASPERLENSFNKRFKPVLQVCI